MTVPQSQSEHICAVCGRQSSQAIGVGEGRRVPLVWTCSQRCRLAVLQSHQYLIEDDLTHFERIARMQGGANGGQYLESIKKTDLSKLSYEEWQAFLHATFDGYHEAMVRQFELVHEAAAKSRGQAT